MVSPKAKQARRRRIVIGLAATLVLAGGAGAYGMGLVGKKSDAARYRTASVTTGSVQELLTLQGSVVRVNQETATFPADGTVTSVRVSVGQSVKAGDRLATLDTTPLTVAVLEAKAALAQAKQAYNDDYTAAHTSTSASTSTSKTPTSPSGSSSGAATAQVAKAMAEVQKALTAERAVCAPVLAAGGTATPTSPAVPTALPAAARSAGGADHTPTESSTPSATTAEPTPSVSATPTPSGSATPTGSGTSASGSPSTSPTTSPSGSPSAGPTSEQVAACAQAVRTLAAAEQKASSALTAAFTALSRSAAAAASSATSGAAASAAKAASSSGAGGQSASSASARLASDTAGITTAEQNLSQAQDNLDGATLVAPITGVVGKVGFVAGGTATASTGVTVVGSGASTVTVNVPLASRSKVAVGQKASVLPAGATTALTGRITSISPLPTSSTSATYPAVVQVEDSPAALTSGALADVSITVGTSANALTIPVSGLVPSSTTSGVVQVLGDAGAVSSVTVSVGAVGGGKVAILAGLTEGQKVVIADASQALPTNSTQNIGRLTSNGGGPGQVPGGTASRAAGSGAAPAGP